MAAWPLSYEIVPYYQNILSPIPVFYQFRPLPAFGLAEPLPAVAGGDVPVDGLAEVGVAYAREDGCLPDVGEACNDAPVMDGDAGLVAVAALVPASGRVPVGLHVAPYLCGSFLAVVFIEGHSLVGAVVAAVELGLAVLASYEHGDDGV